MSEVPSGNGEATDLARRRLHLEGRRLVLRFVLFCIEQDGAEQVFVRRSGGLLDRRREHVVDERLVFELDLDDRYAERHTRGFLWHVERIGLVQQHLTTRRSGSPKPVVAPGEPATLRET